jgi:hypothetical protein
MQTVFALLIFIALASGTWTVCDRTDYCSGSDPTKTPLEEVIAQADGATNAEQSDEQTVTEQKSDEGQQNAQEQQENADGQQEQKQEQQTEEKKTCEPYLSEQIRTSGTNTKSEVIKLEKFLNEYEGEKLIAGGEYDGTDQAAVKRFQEKYKDDVLTPHGLTAPTGEVMTSTIAKINEIYCAKHAEK